MQTRLHVQRPAAWITADDNAVIADLHGSAILDRDDEQALARELRRTGDRRIADRLVRANLRLVVKIAGEYGRGSDRMADLIQEGCVGLMTAVARFDPDRGVRLCSYAAWWIRSEMLRYLAENARLVNVSRTRAGRRQFFRGELPGSELSLDQPLANGTPALVERLSSDDDERPDQLVERAECAERLDDVVSETRAASDERERALFDERLLAENPKTLAEIAARFDVTKERMRQLEQRVLQRLRHKMSEMVA